MDRSMAVELTAPAPEQTRALSGRVRPSDGVNPYWEVYGAGEPTVLLMPTWSIIHSRHWKMQIPYLARHCRVLTFDGPGNGRSDRPDEPDAYREEEFAADALAVMDATATERAVLVSLSRGADVRREPAGARREARVHRPGSAAAAGHAAQTSGAGVRRAARRVRRLGEVEPPLLGRELRGLPRVLLLAVLHGAALDEAARRTRSAGGSRRRPRRRRSPRRGSRTRRACSSSSPASAVRCSSSTAARTRCAPARPARDSRSSRAASSWCSRVGSPPARTRSRQGQPPAPRREAGTTARPLGSRQVAASARSTSPPPSASGTRSAMPRSRTSCASSTPISTSTGSRSIR